MDVLSHGLWAAAAGKGARVDTAGKLNLKWAFFWGVFPDIFAFSIPMTLHLYNIIAIGASLSDHPLSGLTIFLYQASHSLFIFLVVVLVTWLLRKSVPWVMFGWLLHILADIPTHSYQFYPTPALWPLFSWKFDGFSWATGHFELYNYIALVVVFALLYLVTRLHRTSRKII